MEEELTIPWILLYTSIGVLGLVVLSFPFLPCIMGKATGILHEVEKLYPAVRAADCSEEELPSTCPICLGDWEPDDVVRRLPCNHVFHAACIDGWLVKAGRCALCRSHPLNDHGQAASNKPQATVCGLQEEEPPPSTATSPSGSESTATTSIDCESGQHGDLAAASAEAPHMPSVPAPLAAGSSGEAAGWQQKEDAVDLLATLVSKSGIGEQQEGSDVAGQHEDLADDGAIGLLDSAQQQLTPMYIPGVQDHHTGLRQLWHQPCEDGERKEDVCDSTQPLGYVPLSASLRAQTPLVLTASL